MITAAAAAEICPKCVGF